MIGMLRCLWDRREFSQLTSRHGAPSNETIRVALAIVGWSIGVLPFLASVDAWDGPSATSLIPSGAQRGTSIEVKVGGSFPQWPSSVWCDRPGVQWTALEKPGSFRVDMKSDTLAGPCQVRFFESKGASARRTWWVGWTAERIEVEPNDGYRQAEQLESSTAVIHGVLAKNGDFDTFAIPVEQGQTLVASVQANRGLRSPLDTCLQILNDRGTVVAQNLDHHGLDPYLQWKVPQSGRYLVRVFGFPETPDSNISVGGNESFVYRLSISTGMFLEATHPQAIFRSTPTHLELLGPNWPAGSSQFVSPESLEAGTRNRFLFREDALGGYELPIVNHPVWTEDQWKATQTPIQSATTISGSISTDSEVDLYAFQANEGSRWKVSLESRSIGFLADPVLRLLDDQHQALQRVDDGSDSVDPSLSWQSPKSGSFNIEVSDLFQQGSDRHRYRLTVIEERPTAKLSIPNEVVACKVGTPTEVVVDIERLHGFAAELQVECIGAGEGITIQPIISRAADDSAKKVKLIIQSSMPFQGPIQFVGRAQDLLEGLVPAMAADTKSDLLWLSVVEP